MEDRRRKLLIIGIILGNRVLINLDNHKIGSSDEIGWSYICRAWVMFLIAVVEDWTAPYNNLYSFISDLGDVLDEAPETDIESYLGDFETLLELADL